MTHPTRTPESSSSDAPAEPTSSESSPPTSRPPVPSHAVGDDANADDLELLGIGTRVLPPDEDPFYDATATYSGEDNFSAAELLEGDRSLEEVSVEARIREIEARLDGLLNSSPTNDLDEPAPLSPSPIEVSRHDAVDAARELLESDYYRRTWGRGSLREQENEVDAFGLDPVYERSLRPALDFLFKRYFRTRVEGVEHVPAQGRAMIVANHSGALPLDGLMIRQALRLSHPSGRDARWLAEDFSFYLPFIGVAMNRIGAVRACPENGERLLAKNHVVSVFPEGAEGIKKLYKDRYQLQRFGRGGFVRLALRTQSPIVPCAVIGGEEANPILHRFDNLTKLVGLDYLPITPTFPWLGPLGLLPLPTRWRIVFGEPISVADYGPAAASDHVLVGRISERVRAAIAALLDGGLKRRKNVFF
jgi:1-acyl-sn-glycerol-3-phosphate acyltransferase